MYTCKAARDERGCSKIIVEEILQSCSSSVAIRTWHSRSISCFLYPETLEVTKFSDKMQMANRRPHCVELHTKQKAPTHTTKATMASAA